jgi:hypothetical protein
MKIQITLVLLLPVAASLGYLTSASAKDIAFQDPPSEVECSPKEEVEDVYGTLCGSTMLWSQTDIPGDCDETVKKCTHDNIIGLVDACPATVDSFSIENQWAYLVGTGPWTIEYDGDPIKPDCGGNPIYLGMVLRDSGGNPIGGKLMKFYCTACE